MGKIISGNESDWVQRYERWGIFLLLYFLLLYFLLLHFTLFSFTLYNNTRDSYGFFETNIITIWNMWWSRLRYHYSRPITIWNMWMSRPRYHYSTNNCTVTVAHLGPTKWMVANFWKKKHSISSPFDGHNPVLTCWKQNVETKKKERSK